MGVCASCSDTNDGSQESCDVRLEAPSNPASGLEEGGRHGNTPSEALSGADVFGETNEEPPLSRLRRPPVSSTLSRAIAPNNSFLVSPSSCGRPLRSPRRFVAFWTTVVGASHSVDAPAAAEQNGSRSGEDYNAVVAPAIVGAALPSPEGCGPLLNALPVDCPETSVLTAV